MGLVEFEKALVLVSEFFRREERPFAVIGAFALQAYGLTRATQDLDFAAEASVQEKLIAHLSACGYETLHQSLGYSNHLHSDPVLGRLDFVYLDGPTAEALFGSAHEQTGPGGLRVPVPKAEHLVALKVHGIKNDPSRTFRDLADIQYLMGLAGVDRDEIRGYFEKDGLLARYDELRRLL
jgi:hypothetical protein